MARIQFRLDATALPANTAFEIVAPITGYIRRMDAIVQSTITTGGTITVRNWRTGSAVVVDGLSLTFPNAAAKGSKPTVNVPATPGRDSIFVKRGDRVQIFPAGFATAGSVDGFIEFVSLDEGGQAL